MKIFSEIIIKLYMDWKSSCRRLKISRHKDDFDICSDKYRVEYSLFIFVQLLQKSPLLKSVFTFHCAIVKKKTIVIFAIKNSNRIFLYSTTVKILRKWYIVIF